MINLFYDFAPVIVTESDAGAHVVRRGMPLGIGEWWAVGAAILEVGWAAA